MEPDQQDEDAIAAAAQREADVDYGVGLTAPPAPPVGSLSTLSDEDILRARGMHAQERYSGTWAAESSAYRGQYAQAQSGMAAANASAYKAYLAASQKAQIAEAKRTDPGYIAQQVYTQAGSIGGARAIGKSTGASLFTHGEIVEMGNSGSYAIIPAGEVNELQPDGSSKRVSMSRHIQKMGVSVVPFLGGDQAAIAWRGAAAQTSEIMTTLDQLEEVYNGKYGSSISTPGEANRRGEQLEAGLAQAVSRLKSGSKSMAGVSDLELKQLENGIPKSASSLWESEARGLIKINALRDQLRSMLTRNAMMNGIVLTPLRAKAETTAGSTTGQQSSNPPGLNNGRK